jgi:serine/threonine protein kinase
VYQQGDLKQFLRDCRPNLPSPRERLSTTALTTMVIQIADAMRFLEVKHVIHRDLAARNVLVGDNNVVKLADFGLPKAPSNLFICLVSTYDCIMDLHLKNHVYFHSCYHYFFICAQQVCRVMWKRITTRRLRTIACP